MELQKHRPLKGKTFEIKLLPVDDAFKKAFPKYKGKDRYRVTPVPSTPGKTNSASEPEVTEETVKD
jgi:hypothetical protein